MSRTAARLIAIALAALPLGAAAEGPVPPVAPRKEHRTVWHGEEFSDPWFWLREKENPEVRAYLEAENRYAAEMTRAQEPFARALYDETLARIQQTDLSVPERRGRFFYYRRTVEGQQYPLLCRRAAGPGGAWNDGAPEEVLLDQNALAAGLPYLGLGDVEVSDDGRRLLYTADTTGFRQYRLFRRELPGGAAEGPLAERVTGVAWAADGATVFYVTEDERTKRSDTVWRLSPGRPPAKVYEEKDALYAVELSRTRDRRYLVVTSRSTDTWEQRVLDARRPGGALRVVLPRRKGHRYTVEHRQGRFYLRTNLDARDFRVVSAPVADASPARWRPFFTPGPGGKAAGLDLYRDFAVVTERQAGLARFRVHEFAKGTWHTVEMAEAVYDARATGNADADSPTFRFEAQGLASPPAVFDYQVAARRKVLRKQEAVLGGFDAAAYATERLWVKARDGAQVPVSIVYKKGFPRDGSGALWLYGYGSYGYGQSARFRHERLALLDRGVAFAIAHVRGGDEMGELWHQDGMLLEKRNTFRDFVDVAEALVRERWTSPARLVAEGGSAGGLLMGAVVNMRPELFRAVHLAVPFVDVLNTMMDATLPLTVGEYLEWGDPGDPAAFAVMRAYSPYDNLQRTAYPALLVTTSLNDSQVMYWEPAKYVAKLRTLKTDERLLLLRVRMEPAGHGGASGRYDALRDRSWQLAFLLSQVGITR
ncbi:MAG: S9 family peptidase [Deltaproteobacteria bacterium]|nr:S9 family peptidase [Deltaproteobacteria bacterium]